jgi:hypothetical protein
MLNQPGPVFQRRQNAIARLRSNPTEPRVYRTESRSRRTFKCERCADEGAPIAGVVVIPKSDEAQLYCAPCFARTGITRRLHPEWTSLEVSSVGGMTEESLASVLSSNGLLDRTLSYRP